MADRKIYNEIVIDMNPESAGYKEILYEDSFQDDGQLMELKEVEHAGYKTAIAAHGIRDQKETEAKDLTESVEEKALYSQLGKALAQAGLFVATGGTINPVTYAGLTSLVTYGGQRVGESFADPIDGGYYFKDEAEEANKAITGSALTDSIMAGLKAGVGQKLKITSEATKDAQLFNTTNMKDIAAGIMDKKTSADFIADHTSKFLSLGHAEGENPLSNALDLLKSIKGSPYSQIKKRLGNKV